MNENRIDKPEKKIQSVCNSCRSKKCAELYWKDSFVFSDIFAVPFDCPLRVGDESRFRWELQSLSDYDVSRIVEDVWIKHNYGTRYGGNWKQDEIEHLVWHFRQHKCIMIAKSVDPWYKPWLLFGFWSKRGGGFDLQLNPEKKEDEFLTDSLAEEALAQQLPLKITAISWKHTESTRHKESPDTVVDGDKIQFEAQFENYVEGGGVEFFVYGNVNGSKKQIAKIHTSCKSMAATAEWVVDISRCDMDNPGLEFDCEVRDKKSNRCPIDIAIERLGGVYIHLRDENLKTIEGATVTVYANDEVIFSDVVPDGILEITGILESELCIECEYNGLKTKQPLTWVAGNPPYIAEDIVFELGATAGE